MADLYKVLEIERDAPSAVVKSAFRRLASKLHPDRGGGDAQRMAEANKAYAVLGDREKRARYDATGETDEPAPILEKARVIIAQVFSQLLDAGEASIVRAAKTKIVEGRRQVTEGRDAINAKLADIARREGKVSTKASVNLFEGILAARKEALLKGLQAAEEALLLNDEIAKELELYESEPATYFNTVRVVDTGQNDLSAIFGWPRK